ncbi:hypothetical protein [Pseudomonas fluorescens]|uniref:Uncharacterized protein n=1 Tax=Pseudomonas fluorescens TaxID=294 RepID=A0A944HCN6_PSEFL|nr:hypothetical protein [Pseudomonas fluorescens]MBT2295061.1 hypothetical protein [Pseudomonas fluorescens]MBT2309289.1 hypothetical protein [Pseudomonas fluorescens]MBT2313757.1 hypothetical protein [Pseudomonas fluorescens]MBT2318473.1 hypothetical protein [Pseudomonas fluorescens]MBT2329396.1 hypothetical protein [Pseudomonas fluorescens]
MADFGVDAVVESYRKQELKRKPFDPYGGGGQYYAEFQGERTPMFDKLDELKRHLDALINEAMVRGEYHE